MSNNKLIKLINIQAAHTVQYQKKQRTKWKKWAEDLNISPQEDI